MDHHILLCKLEEIGLGRGFVQWSENYPTNRCQSTKLSHVISNTALVTCGVTQGSILGPLFFILYINSIPDIMPDRIMTFLCANDTALVTRGPNSQEVGNNLNTALSIASDWFRNHKLSLNMNETKCMLFGTHQKVNNSDDPTVGINNSKVEIVPQFKYLGVILDSNLRFDAHISNAKRKVYAKIKALGKARQCVSKNMALQHCQLSLNTAPF